MAETGILSGKVLKRSLPTYEGPAGENAPTMKRLLLPQGELAQLYDSDEPIRYLAYIELRAGSARGNHFHIAREEFVYVIQGDLTLVVEDIQTKVRESVPLAAGDVAVISSNVAHALQTTRSGHAIEFSKTRFDLTDIHRYPLV